MSDNRPVGGKALREAAQAALDWCKNKPWGGIYYMDGGEILADHKRVMTALEAALATVAPPATPALEAGGEDALGPCRVCGRDVGASAWLCDRENLPTCEDCQPKTPCGREEHGEGCPTHVFSDQPSAQHEAEQRYPMVGGYKSYMLAAQQAFVAGAEWSAARTPPRGPDQSGGVALDAREDGR